MGPDTNPRRQSSILTVISRSNSREVPQFGKSPSILRNLINGDSAILTKKNDNTEENDNTATGNNAEPDTNPRRQSSQRFERRQEKSRRQMELFSETALTSRIRVTPKGKAGKKKRGKKYFSMNSMTLYSSRHRVRV